MIIFSGRQVFELHNFLFLNAMDAVHEDWNCFSGELAAISPDEATVDAPVVDTSFRRTLGLPRKFMNLAD